MAVKLGTKTLPTGKSSSDFTYRGRPAKDQGDFGADVGIAELEAVDLAGAPEEKFYHGGVVQSSDGQWWVYLEWGKTSAASSWTGDSCSQSFQFVRGDDEADARDFFAKQMASKNNKRLTQKTISGQPTWVSKTKSSGYKVIAPTQTRGLPTTNAAPTPAPAPAPAPVSTPAAALGLEPFVPALAAQLVKATSDQVVRTHTIGALVAETHAQGILITLPAAGGSPRVRLLLSRRHLTLPDQQLSLEDIEGIVTDGGLTLVLAAGPVVVKTRLDKQQASWVEGTIKLHVARRRAALATLRQLR